MFRANFPPLIVLLVALGLMGPGDNLYGIPQPPDIQMEIPNTWDQNVNGTGQPILRFSTYTVNRGTGALELHCDAPSGGTRNVDQWVFDSNGSHTTTFVGTFLVDGSGRVKFEDSADYFLREINEDGSVGGIVGAREKVAYCVVDSFMATNPPPGTPPNAHYLSCGTSTSPVTLGISVGWVDNYGETISTQNIVLVGISSGNYWLENIADPLNRLIESNDSNNYTKIQVTINTTYTPEINLVGNSLSIPDNDVTPTLNDHTDFGYVDVASGSVTRTFTIQNTGTGTLSLTSVPRIEITGSDFVVTTQPISPVTNGSSVTFQVTFNPSSLGVKNATINILNNDANEGTYEFAIRGNTDADADGLPDGWETLHNVTSPTADNDGDGLTNLEEFNAGTSPRDPASTLKIKSITRTGTTAQITFDTLTGRTYRVEYKDQFANNWTQLPATPGTGGQVTVNDSPTPLKRFYRLSAGLN